MICDLKPLTQKVRVHGTSAQGCLFPLPVQLISSSKRLVLYCGSVFQLSLKNDFELILHGTPAIRTKSLEYGLGSPSLTLTLFLLNLEGGCWRCNPGPHACCAGTLLLGAIPTSISALDAMVGAGSSSFPEGFFAPCSINGDHQALHATSQQRTPDAW